MNLGIHARTEITLVSIGVVALNEEAYLSTLLEDISGQDYPLEKIELLLVDGKSNDGTKKLMLEFAHSSIGDKFARVEVFTNEDKILPAGCNIILNNFTGDCIIRIDAHSRIPSDFIRRNVELMEEGEDVCAGPRPTIACPDTPWAQTLLLAENSAFGSSVADYRFSTKKEYVQSAFHAMFHRRVVESVGLYNEKLARTEDNDYFYRVKEAGYRVRFDRRIRSTQIARSTFKRMLKQKYGNGFWVGRTVYEQPKCLAVHHFVPLVFVLGVLAMVIVGASLSWIPFLLCTAMYVLLCVVMALRACMQAKQWSFYCLCLPLIFAGIHFSYGIGTVIGLCAGLIKPLSKN